MRSSSSPSPPRLSSMLGVVTGGRGTILGVVRSAGDVVQVYLARPGKTHSSNSARSEMIYFLVEGLKNFQPL